MLVPKLLNSHCLGGNLQYTDTLEYQPDVESFDVEATPFPGISFPPHNIAYKIL